MRERERERERERSKRGEMTGLDDKRQITLIILNGHFLKPQVI